MISVGVTGGIGSGKTVFARELALLGAAVIDADELAHAAIEPGGGAWEAAREAFPECLDRKGRGLDRDCLARLVFSDPKRRQLLEALVHPVVRRAIQSFFAEVQAEVAVAVVPLLVEAGWGDDFDFVVVVDLDEEEALRRAVELRGMGREDVLRRMAAQAPRAERLRHADFVVDNSGSPEDLRRRAAELWAELKRRSGAVAPKRP